MILPDILNFCSEYDKTKRKVSELQIQFSFYKPVSELSNFFKVFAETVSNPGILIDYD